MKKYVFIFLAALLCQSCQKQGVTKLKFLDEFVLQDSLQFKNTIIGGLSGIDYANNQYYMVVDDAQNPRIIISDIQVKDKKITDIQIKDVIFLQDSIAGFYKENILDLESVFVDEKTQEIHLVSEGSIKNGEAPSVFKMNDKGAFVASFKLPQNLTATSEMKHNATFEGSSNSVDNLGFWVAMEGPLKGDGDEPSFVKKKTPIRITYFDKSAKIATKQYAYELDYLTQPSKGNINLNGATALLEYKKNHLFVVERMYQNGYGSYGNTIKIYEAIIDESATNILEVGSLRNTKFKAVKKRLLLNFDDIKEHLTDGIIDNIEGITLGPKLPNGNPTLLLISDDNFQVYDTQLNQFILFEIENK